MWIMFLACKDTKCTLPHAVVHRGLSNPVEIRAGTGEQHSYSMPIPLKFEHIHVRTVFHESGTVFHIVVQ
jgi:hypothetical protein